MVLFMLGINFVMFSVCSSAVSTAGGGGGSEAYADKVHLLGLFKRVVLSIARLHVISRRRRWQQ